MAVLRVPVADVAANATGVPPEHSVVAARRPMPHRILTEAVSSDIGAVLRGLRTENGTDTTVDTGRDGWGSSYGPSG
ncbi:MAG: hypothetical protein OXG82_05635 [Gammaproteobacteria bacterium]|nr:hypothetical protein [Gammaproteobacteria bacterium]